MALGEGGVIRVTTRSDGDFLAIEIADDGPGMDARTRENVFDEYFLQHPPEAAESLAALFQVFARAKIEALLRQLLERRLLLARDTALTASGSPATR